MPNGVAKQMRRERKRGPAGRVYRQWPGWEWNRPSTNRSKTNRPGIAASETIPRPSTSRRAAGPRDESGNFRVPPALRRSATRKGAHRRTWSTGRRAWRTPQPRYATEKPHRQIRERFYGEAEYSSRALRYNPRGNAGIRHRQHRRGNKNREVGAALQAVPAGNISLMLANDAVARAQSKASSLPNGFGGEKWLESVLRMPETRPGIRKLDAHLRFARPYGNQHFAPAHLFQRVHRVRNNLQKDVKQLAGIGQHRRAPRLGLQLNTNVLQFVDAAQMERAFDQRLYFHGCELQRGFLGEPLHVFDQGIRSLRILPDFPGEGAAPRFGVRTRNDERGLLADPGHRFPNLVSDAGHQLAE